MLPVIIIILVNIAGFILKYFELDRDIVILGFRFHLSLALPFIIVFFRKDYLSLLENYLTRPADKKYMFTSAFIILPVLILVSLLYLVKALEVSDPDYFYELGMTSILDYPVYFIWNLPQLLMFASFLLVAVHDKKYKFLLILILVVSLFIYEFIPLKTLHTLSLDAVAFVIASVLFSMFLSKIKNIYLFSFALFSTLWLNALIFGSNSRIIVNLLLARTYLKWEGFVEVKNTYYPYIMIGHFTIAFILFFVPFMLNSRQDNKTVKNEFQLENLNK